jgi:hypothetical protein
MARPRKQQPQPTPEEIKALIDGQDWTWQQRLWQLFLSDPNSQIGKNVRSLIGHHFVVAEQLEAKVEARTRKPKNYTDLLGARAQGKKQATLAAQLTKQEGKKVTTAAVKQRIRRAKNRRGRIGMYATKTAPKGTD